ncbi:MAG TPA: hypothetical protein VGX23_00245 [Actinocrinis sp.]|nr:hypothetical protein [Actinocrinis sp.]
MTAATPPAAREIATLTPAQSDRLYLDWHDKVADEVCDAVALATGYRERRAEAFAALQRDITAIDLSHSAPTSAHYPHDSAPWRALQARHHLREAERHYARRDPEHALRLLQGAAATARHVLTDLGWTPAP